MKKVAAFIVKHKIWILGLMALLTIGSLVAMSYVNINSDILSYLPENADMTVGMNFMKENFNMQGDAIIGVAGVDYEEMKKITGDIAKESAVKPGGVIWIGSVLEMKDVSMGGVSMGGMIDDMLANPDLMGMFYPNEGIEGFVPEVKANYMIMLQLQVPTSSDEALNFLDKLDKTILAGHEHSIGGSTKITKDIFDSTIGEIWKYLIVAVLVMFIILLLTTTSLTEPIIFMLTLGISIAINMGTNLILPSVSVVTFAASSILQLGLSMDYAIFLMHAYDEERKKTLDDNLAMQRAIPKTFSTISASALTTVGGFLALFFMEFKIGADLGIVLAKGVFLSLLTVLVLQPCLMLATSKLTKKTSHRIYLPKLKKVASFSVSHRKVLVVIAILLIIPAIVLQNMVELTYIKFTENTTPDTEIGQMVDSMSNSVIVIVPYDQVDKQYEFLDEVKQTDDVTSVMGLYSMVPKSTGNMLYFALKNNLIPPEASMVKNFASNGYTMYSIMVKAEPESAEATAALTRIRDLTAKYFPHAEDGTGAVVKTNHYVTGMTQAVEDLKAITPRDFMIVTLVSVAIIFLILILALRSIKLSALLIALIELGIFVNLSISFVFGQAVNFMAYIIISSIQLGATVDYAILYTIKYQRYLDVMSAKEAGYRALRDSGVSVITSVAIMAGCCLSVSLVTTNIIVGEITMMIARGSIISGILVMVFLPALLVVCTGNKKLTKKGRYMAKILRQEKKDADAHKPKAGAEAPQIEAAQIETPSEPPVAEETSQ